MNEKVLHLQDLQDVELANRAIATPQGITLHIQNVGRGSRELFLTWDKWDWLVAWAHWARLDTPD